jgi:electron transport complex protein RnfB
MPPPLVVDIDACLPQTQCTRCGFPRCRDYAAALARGDTALNRCPPGGEPTIALLAHLLKCSSLPLDPACGVHEPRRRAVIDEQVCIGCRKCIDVCPVDAIVGARKWMHTVIAAECNGCALCLPACPVDCIALVPVALAPDPASPWPEYPRADTARWRVRTAARLARLARRKPKRARPAKATADSERERIRAEIRAAVGRARNKRRALRH